MIREKKQKSGPIIIDLTGPAGNAFALIGMAKRFGHQLCWNSSKCQDLINQMMDGDYEHLLQVFDNAFGEFVILER
jgi:hypothetical protein